MTKNVRATLLYSNKHSPSTIYIYNKHTTLLVCEGNSHQSQVNSFSMLCRFDVACFGSYARSHHQINERLLAY